MAVNGELKFICNLYQHS